MKNRNFLILILCSLVFLPLNGWSQDQNQDKEKDQDSTSFYINIGYITNIQKNSETVKADQGASLRLGILTKKRLGFYAGYIFFKEYHPTYAEYDDEGYGFVGGIDYMILKKNDLKLYLKAGLFLEKYKSTYRHSGKVEIETSPKPDFGILLNYKHFNAYLGWQPSDPPHINIGVGMTI